MSRKKPQITENIDLTDSLKAKFVVRGKKITDKQRDFLIFAQT